MKKDAGLTAAGQVPRPTSTSGAGTEGVRETPVDINLSPAPHPDHTEDWNAWRIPLMGGGADKTHIVLLGHGWCESPLPRVMTETSAPQPNGGGVNHR